MKKMVISFILGMLAMTGIVVIAENLNASSIDYKDTTVESALDTLYERSTYTEYNGTTTVTPSHTSRTLETNNKLLKSNITIGAIPSTYKELSTSTTVEANYLLNGKTAYNSNGNLITGGLNTNCVSGTYTKAANSQLSLDFGIVPTKIQIYFYNPNGSTHTFVLYNSSYNSNIYAAKVNTTDAPASTSAYTLSGGVITSNYSTSLATYKNQISYSYVACK